MTMTATRNAAGWMAGIFGMGVGVAALVTTLVAGPLSPPPGAVAPTYKTLTEVEPRTIISAATTPGDADSQFVISQPGSYYLASNITGVAGKHGIRILSGGVTLDLNGFALRGVTGSLDGVFVPTFVTGVTIRNGTLKGWQNGVSANIDNGAIEDLRVDGCTRWGIRATNSFALIIRNCEVFSNGSDTAAGDNRGGIFASSAIITGCIARINQGDGFRIDESSVASGCQSRQNVGRGYAIDTSSTLIDSTAALNGLNGVRVFNNSVVRGMTVVGNGSNLAAPLTDRAGISVGGQLTRIEGNSVSSNQGAGIAFTSTSNSATGNWLGGNAAGAITGAAGNAVGPLVGAAALAGATSPGANFVP